MENKSQKIGLLFVDEPNTFINKTGEEVKVFTGVVEGDENKELVAYVNTSKTGKKYLAIYIKPKYQKGNKATKAEQATETIDPTELPF